MINNNINKINKKKKKKEKKIRKEEKMFVGYIFSLQFMLINAGRL